MCRPKTSDVNGADQLPHLKGAVTLDHIITQILSVVAISCDGY